MKKLKKLSHALLGSATLFMLSQSAQGLGLGTIEIDSYLNQPLVAIVHINDMADVTPSELRVSMASREAFEKAGIEHNFLLTDFDFEVRNDNGQSYVLIKSSKPIKDPFLSFVVEAKWASGKVLREYTVLLDPIEMKSNVAKAKSKIYSKASNIASQAPSAPLKTGQIYGPVAPNESLWEIASRFSQTTGAEVEQTMLAIAAINPDAFLRGNINGLKQKAKLKLPTAAQANQISLSEAISRIREHNVAWQTKAMVAPIQLETASLEKEHQKPVELLSPKPLQMNEDKPSGALAKVQAPQQGQPILTSPTSLSQRPDKPSPEFQSRLLVIEETLDTLKQINLSLQKDQEDLKKRNQELMAMLKAKEQELLIIKTHQQAQTLIEEQEPSQTFTEASESSTMAHSQEVLQSPDEVKSKGNDDATYDPKSTLSQSLQDQIASYTEHQGQKTKLIPGASASKMSGQVQPEPSQVSTTQNVLPAPAVMAQTPDSEVPSSQGSMTWLVLLLGFAASAGIGYEYLRRNRPELLEGALDKIKNFRQPPSQDKEGPEAVSLSEPTPLSDEPSGANSALPESAPTHQADIEEAFSVFDETVKEQAKRPKLVQESVSSLGAPEASSKNPLADIDVYLEYKRYDQARELIMQHLEKNPMDWEAHVKLLEVYQRKQDFEALREHLNQLPSDLAAQAPNEWQKIQAILEQSMNDVIAAGLQSQAPSPTHMTPPQELSHDEESKAFSDDADHLDVPMQIDASLQKAQEQVLAATEPASTDDAHDALNLARQCGVEEQNIQFELEAVEPQQESPEQALSSQFSDSQLSQPQETTPDQTNTYLQDRDEMETKMALARAYLDLGDVTLAQEQLNEVLQHGNEVQKQLAVEMLEKIEKGV